MKEHYDGIVIGTGQAGPSLAVRMAGAGQRVAIIERDRFGGTCVNQVAFRRKRLLPPTRRTWLGASGHANTEITVARGMDRLNMPGS